jgi:GTP pyrophosphokinase
MVKVKENAQCLADGKLDPTAWLESLEANTENMDVLRHACTLAQLTGEDHLTPSGETCLQKGLRMAEILVDLDVDSETLAAAVVYDTFRYTDLSLEDVETQLGKAVARLVLGVKRMNLAGSHVAPHHQAENQRKMLLAMVDDVRGVLIKLAEQLYLLRLAPKLEESMRLAIAQEVMDVYAPLANRLGVGTMKWEMEDLAFRYLKPDAYKKIAKGLNEKRLDRDDYVKNIVDKLDAELKKAMIKQTKVYGRSKHIHSIYRKMTQKDRELGEIYDATAVRVMVDTEEDCYAALSLVHQLWEPIPSEFDDYIANPKPNGYQSLHTAVIGPEGKHFEVQVRTYQMHDLAELGVAAHWKYKEGGATVKESHERKIEWLREVLSWHRELSGNKPDVVNQTAFVEDRVYVFTPQGEIVDLPQGSTPLDFAYHVHTQVGHRCRGAKINGAMVNLVYVLKMGDQVEILTGNKAQPSRDWLNSHLGYLKSSRSRAKVLQWFREQDFERHQEDGEKTLEREFKKLNIRDVSIEDLAKQFDFKKKEEFFATLGRGDLKIAAVLQKISQTSTSLAPVKPKVAKTSTEVEKLDKLYIEGLGNLVTHMAHCCNPVAGDPIVGYVTIGRGISIHHQNCPNILEMDLSFENRIVQVSWGRPLKTDYAVELAIEAYERQGLARDITTLLTTENANLLSFSTKTNKEEHKTAIHIHAELGNLEALSRLIEKLQQLHNVILVERK